MSDWTPGPWRIVLSGLTTWRIMGPGHEYDALANTFTEANARLIAAAPELLAAVKELSSPDAEGTINRERSARIAALIAKAEGRPEA